MKITFTILVLILLLGCTNVMGAAPTITTFSPATGAIGSSVTITGTNFNTTVAQNIVFFGATQAVVTAASETSLTVTVPLGATYQYLSVTNLGTQQTAYSAKPYIVTLAGNITFIGKVDFSTGLYPLSVSIGDIDGDGKPDLAVANNNSNTVSVFRNTSTSGTVSFATKVNFTTGTSPYSVSIGDLDGDGKPDLAVANYNSNSVSVFRNTSVLGTVSFAAKVDFATGLSPYSVNMGDIDGDGKPDLAVANFASTSLSVFLNTSNSGSLSFATKVDLSTASAPFSISMGDIDGDGKVDLVSANYSYNTVSVFRNTSTSGSVSFAAKADFATDSSPFSVKIGDIDGDGKPDLAVANFGGDNVSVIRQISPPATITSFTPASASTGTTVTITGTNLTGTMAVSFGGAAATSFNVVSATSITALVANGTSGFLSVTTPDGESTLA